jgi:Holliday junction DNA helicase RuvA
LAPVIASLTGTVRSLSLDSAVLTVGGVGLSVQATPTTLAGLRVGSQADLATSLVVREDALTLFGFADDEERDVFELLQTVSGVGPRLALAMLAVHTPDQLRRAVATEDFKALERVPGIGRKGAQRIVLEIGDRLGPARGADEAPGGPAPAAVPDAASAQVVDALVGLGWTVRNAEEAVNDVLAGGHAVSDTAGLLRAALRALGGRSGVGGGARG